MLVLKELSSDRNIFNLNLFFDIIEQRLLFKNYKDRTIDGRERRRDSDFSIGRFEIFSN